MSDVGAEAAQRHREHMRDKAARLGGGEDAERVDASSFTPGEPLDADAKTGMRPVSRQGRKHGGPVRGEMSPLGAHALARPGRAPRARGGDVGDEYVNRNAKRANSERPGFKHDLGLADGGRASRATGGRAASGVESVYHPRKERAGAAHQRELTKKSASAAEVDVPKTIVRADGGRVARQTGGPLAPPISNAGRLGSFNYRPGGQGLVGLKDGGRAKAHERYGPGPGPAEHHPGMNERYGRANGGATPGPAENVGTSDAGPLGAPGPGEHQGAVGQESFRHRAPKGENSVRARTLAAATARASGGKVAEGALKQHRAEHAAMGAGKHPKGCSCVKCAGGRAGKAYGGDAYGRSPENVQFQKDADEQEAGGPRPKGVRLNNEQFGQLLGKLRAQAKEGPVSDERLQAFGDKHAAAVAKVRKQMMGRKDGGGFRTASGNVSAAGRAKAEAKGQTMPGGGFPIRNESDLENAKQSVGRAKNPAAARAWINKRAKQLGEPGLGESRAERARGGKSGKGKTNINIVIGTPGGMSQGQGPVPPGANPQLGIRPPPAAAPMPMPMPGAAPPAGMPMPMPIPMPGAAGPAGPPGPPGGMPPRARGGRAPKVRGEPEAGSGSGLGRLQKAAEYGHRSREGAGWRK